MPNLPETNETPLIALNGEVVAAQIAANAVTEPKIKEEAVSGLKLKVPASPLAGQGLMMPLLAGGAPVSSNESKGGALVAVFSRAIVPITGKIKDVSVLNGATIAGESNLAIFDTGDAKAGEYTLLAESGAKAHSGANKWQSMGTLGELTVTAGQHVLLMIVNSSTGSYKGTAALTTTAAELPTEYLKCVGGASPKLLGEHTFAEIKVATIKEAELTAGNASNSAAPMIVARIS